MSDERVTVSGSFDSVERVRSAVSALRQSGLKNTVVYSPVNSHEIQAAVEGAEGPMGIIAFGGAAIGGALGLLLTIGTSLQHPMITGGQPIVSLPPFFVISFELTILFGVVATVAGLLWGIRRGRSNPKFYRSRFSSDRFGVSVVCDRDRIAVIKNLLSSAGAEDVRDEKY